MTALAKEMATGIADIPDILKALDITEAEYKYISRHRRFPQLLSQFKNEWEGVDNTPARVRMKAALALETCIPEVAAQIHNREAPLTARAALVTALGKIAGLDKGQAETNTGGGFKVTINLGDNNAVVKQGATPLTCIEGELA